VPVFSLGPAEGGNEPLVFVGGEVVGAADAFEDVEDAYVLSVERHFPDSCLNADLGETPPRLWEISCWGYEISLLQQIWHARIIIYLKKHEVFFALSPAWPNWSSLFTITELRNSIEAISAEDFGVVTLPRQDPDEITCVIKRDFAQYKLGNLIDDAARTLTELFDAAFSHAARNNPRAVVSVFRFPIAVASACEQYLIHFVDFLRDIGVDATADLRHEAGQVLFTVTPTDRDQALELINEALTVYLNLPGAVVELGTAFPDEQLVIDKLQMNLHHLNAQLTAARMVMRLQESTIAAQELTIDAQRQLFAGVQKPHTDKETVIPGVLDVVTVEGRGLRIDLPAVVRRFKALFRKP
jgi:hypothetical protein